MSVSKPITVKGKTFKSINEACRYHNVSSSNVNRRLNDGWSIEEAFGFVKRKNSKYKDIILEGVYYESIKEACRWYLLDYDNVKNRLNRLGWTLEEAFELVERDKENKGTSKPITIKDKTFKSFKEACRYYKLNSSIVSGRLKTGWSIEEAFGLVIKKDGGYKPVTVDGKTFRSVGEASRYYNVDYDKARKRINSGWTNEEAFELVPRCRKRGKNNVK